MEKLLGAEALKEIMMEFQREMEYAIQKELRRINRPVQMEELNCTPFNERVADYIDAIRLDEDGNPVLDTSFSNISEKYLASFISDNEIDHWDMITLLEMLKTIEPVKSN